MDLVGIEILAGVVAFALAALWLSRRKPRVLESPAAPPRFEPEERAATLVGAYWNAGANREDVIAGIAAEFRNVEAALLGSHAYVQAVDVWRKELDRLQAEAAEARRQLDLFVDSRRGTERIIEDLKDEIDDLEARKKALRAELAQAELARRAAAAPPPHRPAFNVPAFLLRPPRPAPPVPGPKPPWVARSERNTNGGPWGKAPWRRG